MIGPAERLERSQWDLFWVPSDVRVVDRPEFLAMGCARPLPHLNMVLRTRVSPEALPARVAEARALMAAERRWFVTDTFDSQPLIHVLESSGWRPVHTYDARAVNPDQYVEGAHSGADCDVRQVMDLSAMRDQATVLDEAFGRPQTETDEELRSQLSHCVGPDRRVWRYVAYLHGEPACQGSMTWHPTLRFVFLWGGGTVPGARGRGLYRAVLKARIRQAKRLGAEWVGVYARTDTSSPIVANQGFTRVGATTYYRDASHIP